MEHDDKFEQANFVERISVEIHLDHQIYDGICDTTHSAVRNFIRVPTEIRIEYNMHEDFMFFFLFIFPLFSLTYDST